MALKNINISDIIKDKKINSNFLSVNNKKFTYSCKAYKGNFCLDSYNYFPIINNEKTFLELYSWGKIKKYNHFYQKEFFNEFIKKEYKFKVFKNAFVLGSSALDNHYRNLITFLPRIFFIPDKEINLAIHRNSSNNFRYFLENILKKNGKKLNKVIYLDNEFYKFQDSLIPQFFSKEISIKILNNLSIKDTESKRNKIYITRKDNFYRNILNEKDITDILREKKFRIINLNNFSLEEQIKIFSSSDVIISATGSSLANIVFCKEGTKIYEIVPEYKLPDESNLQKRYIDICKTLNLKHFFYKADSIKTNKHNPILSNFVNIKIIEESNYYKDMIIKIRDFKKLIGNI